MLRKMFDPDGVCGEDIRETVKWRSFAGHCSSLFVNIACELICQWTEGDDDDAVCFPDIEVDHTEPEPGKRNNDVRDDLNKCSDNNVDRPDNRIPSSKPFYCLKPLSKDEIEKLELDNEDVVECPKHCPEQNFAECVHCHARQQQLVERADFICKEAMEEFKIRGVRKVFDPLASAK